MCMNIPAKMFKISPIITSPTDQPIVKSMVFIPTPNIIIPINPKKPEK